MEEAAKGMTPGSHGSTFGGNPLAMAVGIAVASTWSSWPFDHVLQHHAPLFKQRLAEIKDCIRVIS